MKGYKRNCILTLNVVLSFFFWVISGGSSWLSCRVARESLQHWVMICWPSAWLLSTPSWTLGSTSCSERRWSSSWWRRSSVYFAKWADEGERMVGGSAALTATSPPSTLRIARHWWHMSSRTWTLHRPSCVRQRETTRGRFKEDHSAAVARRLHGCYTAVRGTRPQRGDFHRVIWKMQCQAGRDAQRTLLYVWSQTCRRNA